MELLLNKLKENKVIESDIVYNAMLQVDRGEFTDSPDAYRDR
jgi:protein-L-isoaspartate O-methyltransferase